MRTGKNDEIRMTNVGIGMILRGEIPRTDMSGCYGDPAWFLDERADGDDGDEWGKLSWEMGVECVFIPIGDFWVLRC